MSKIKQGGFTIIELLITLIVIGVVFSAFLTTFVTIKSINKNSTDIQTANTLAFNKVQQYEDKVFSTLPNTSPSGTLVEVEDFSATLPTTLPGNRSAKVFINTYPTGTLKQVVVRIDYGYSGAEKRIEYADLIQRDGI